MRKFLRSILCLLLTSSVVSCESSESDCSLGRFDDGSALTTSPTTKPTGSPSAMWYQLYKAMQKADRDQIRQLTNENGYRDIAMSSKGIPLTDEELRRRGMSWAGEQLRLNTLGVKSRVYRIGVVISEQTAIFEETPDGWRLTRWFPGQ